MFVYLIRRLADGMTYIGTTTTSVRQRFREHLRCAFKQQRSQPLYNALNFYRGVQRPENTTAVTASLAFFMCPSDGARLPTVDVPAETTGKTICTMATGNYVLSIGTVRPTCRVCRDTFDGVFGRDLAIGPADIIDGLSQTFGGGERAWKWSAVAPLGVVPHSASGVTLKPAWILWTAS